jgi:hypothetical protein
VVDTKAPDVLECFDAERERVGAADPGTDPDPVPVEVAEQKYVVDEPEVIGGQA